MASRISGGYHIRGGRRVLWAGRATSLNPPSGHCALERTDGAACIKMMDFDEGIGADEPVETGRVGTVAGQITKHGVETWATWECVASRKNRMKMLFIT